MSISSRDAHNSTEERSPHSNGLPGGQRPFFSLAARFAFIIALLTCQNSALAQATFTGGQMPGQRPSLAPINLISQQILRVDPNPTTIIPTDVVPLAGNEERQTFSENLQLRIMQRLPAKFYFNANTDATFRIETNVFQTPTKRSVINNSNFAALDFAGKVRVLESLRLVSQEDQVFRVLPNITAGWAFTPHTRAYANYFLIRDSLFHHPILNTTIQSVGGGVQHDIPIGRKANLQFDLQARELFQTDRPALFDYLPNVTLSYLVSPRTVAFASTLLQMRGRHPFAAPTAEIDPFYTFGFVHQRRGWIFTNTATFLQNFREPFRQNAIIPINNYTWVLDFEVARQISRKFPGLYAFIRAEPIYNFKSQGVFGLSGMDFRLFYGIRLQLAKAALTTTLKQIREQLEDQEAEPPPPRIRPLQSNKGRSQTERLACTRDGAHPPGKRARYELMPYEITAASPQPMHGFISDDRAPLVIHPTARNEALSEFTRSSMSESVASADRSM